jgi:hypothetical protein
VRNAIRVCFGKTSELFEFYFPFLFLLQDVGILVMQHFDHLLSVLENNLNFKFMRKMQKKTTKQFQIFKNDD